MNLDELLNVPPYAIPQSQKDLILRQGLEKLQHLHVDKCPQFRNIVNKVRIGKECGYPGFLPVSMFKEYSLKSVADNDVHKVLTSSGTSGQAVSKIYLDSETATLQGKALSHIMSHVLGPKRLPMLIIDHAGVVKNRTEFSARGAGILGMMTFGRDHTFALDENLKPQVEVVKNFLEKHKGTPKLIFGFTFVVWLSLMENDLLRGMDFSQSILVHSGGWKKLLDKAVSNQVFRKKMSEHLGIERIYNFYGMVEQVGSVFVEANDGFLYPPSFADVIIRDPYTFEELPNGKPGIIQVVSLLPKSYPGHSLLTEDLGVIHSVDSGVEGRYGKAFSVIGRVPQAELRGCSDVIAAGG